mmetsp:Transcript_17829/g.30166  ORF Transcript_17829/g.30166 Transcript_17829/m.30166 type:complete len:313 (+) Transcript_17829:233-1171(+)
MLLRPQDSPRSAAHQHVFLSRWNRTWHRWMHQAGWKSGRVMSEAGWLSCRPSAGHGGSGIALRHHPPSPSHVHRYAKAGCGDGPRQWPSSEGHKAAGAPGTGRSHHRPAPALGPGGSAAACASRRRQPRRRRRRGASHIDRGSSNQYQQPCHRCAAARCGALRLRWPRISCGARRAPRKGLAHCTGHRHSLRSPAPVHRPSRSTCGRSRRPRPPRGLAPAAGTGCGGYNRRPSSDQCRPTRENGIPQQPLPQLVAAASAHRSVHPGSNRRLRQHHRCARANCVACQLPPPHISDPPSAPGRWFHLDHSGRRL